MIDRARPERPPVRQQARDWWRAAQVLWHVVPLGVSFRRDVRRWVWWGAPAVRRAEFHERRVRRLVDHIAALGPATVKLAQIFAARADLVPEPYVGTLASLTDQVPPVPWASIRATLHRAWGRAPETVVDDLDPVPLAAGSLGQVHRARFEGRDVVVKVLRPGVDAVVTQDVRIAQWIVDRLYARMPHHHVLGFRVVLDEFASHVGEEMDFEREARQCTRMRERFADEPRLRIPAVALALTRRDVLVLEYLSGDRIDRLAPRIARGDVRINRLVELLIEIYARMMLRDGVFHADPHPGNLLVDAEGRLILLDFGMVIDVSPATRRALFETIIAAIRRDASGTTDGFYALGVVAPGTTRETMQALVDVLLGIAYSEASTVDRARVLADRVMRELFAWPIVLPGELVYFARTAALIEGKGARYDPAFNSIRVASPIVLRLRRELLVALVGGAAARDPLVSWAAPRSVRSPEAQRRRSGRPPRASPTTCWCDSGTGGPPPPSGGDSSGGGAPAARSRPEGHEPGGEERHRSGFRHLRSEDTHHELLVRDLLRAVRRVVAQHVPIVPQVAPRLRHLRERHVTGDVEVLVVAVRRGVGESDVPTCGVPRRIERTTVDQLPDGTLHVLRRVARGGQVVEAAVRVHLLDHPGRLEIRQQATGAQPGLAEVGARRQGARIVRVIGAVAGREVGPVHAPDDGVLEVGEEGPEVEVGLVRAHCAGEAATVDGPIGPQIPAKRQGACDRRLRLQRCGGQGKGESKSSRTQVASHGTVRVIGCRGLRGFLRSFVSKPDATITRAPALGRCHG
jgi:predicted unusual protein kinase regulating ubiquinone biosynthesis (AarF/ABC1/UbiB family)